MSKEKDWPLNLGMLDWDTTSIVFTKRTLVEFLKYTGVTVDTNLSNIQKLPRYAQFGKLSDLESSQSDETAGLHANTSKDDDDSEIALPEQENPPAGIERTALDEEEEMGFQFSPQVKPSRRVRTVPGGSSSLSGIFTDGDNEEFKPTRRVTQRPGGQDNVAGCF